ncbi:SCP-like protein [Dictyocaulus viviparus]|uniref:SCP-like protein n=1 Tax=Dictyocaulus viviparus TaxID=29172 RepID=A0A0D8Y9V5_DICVI|nr:SCP-like protein [Dictyocaulus viviparus]
MLRAQSVGLVILTTLLSTLSAQNESSASISASGETTIATISTIIPTDSTNSESTVSSTGSTGSSASTSSDSTVSSTDSTSTGSTVSSTGSTGTGSTESSTGSTGTGSTESSTGSTGTGSTESSTGSTGTGSTESSTGSTGTGSTVSSTGSTGTGLTSTGSICTCPTVNPTGSTTRPTGSTIRPTGSSTTRRTTTALLSTKPPSTDCGFTLMSNAYRVLALGKHNSFRSNVARGRARNGEYSNENAPPSSRMDLLVYDCGAEQHAFNHVRSCDRQTSPQNARPGYSENIHVLSTTNTDDLGALQNAIQTWENELENNGIPSNMVYSQGLASRTQKIVTNVTKIIWGNNRYVGCATIRCSGFYFTSCMYKNPVNDVGSSIYQIGAVCSACLDGVNNCNGDIALCSW